MNALYKDYSEISVTTSGRVATVTFEREAQRNSFSGDMKRQCIDAFRRLSDDREVGAVILTGRGKHFCAGGNIAELKSYIDKGTYITPEIAGLTIDWIRAIRGCRKPVIAMVNGAAMGGGAAVASACDFRFMQPSSKFGMAFINIGLSCDSSAMYSLSRVIGLAKAQELIMTGEICDGQEAARLGWARLTGEGELVRETEAFAAMLAAKPGAALAKVKAMANAVFWSDFEAYEELEIRSVVESGRSYDHLEGINAFLEKRPPSFRHE